MAEAVSKGSDPFFNRFFNRLSGLDHEACHRTLQFYYRSPSPEAAAEALRWWVTASHSMQVDFHTNPCNLVLYAFVCLAELHPQLIRTSEQLYREANSWGQRFLARLLAPDRRRTVSTVRLDLQ